MSRSTGKTSVQSAAYITATSLYESRRALKHNYSKRKVDIASWQPLRPMNAQEKYSELSVWDKLDLFEDEYAIKRYPKNLEYRYKYLNSTQTAILLVVALPKELSIEKNTELVDTFATQRYVEKGLIVTYAVYANETNPHAQLQVSRRSANKNGSFSWAKNREMYMKKELFALRKFWADFVNFFLEHEEVDACIIEKIFAELGIDTDPSRHRGLIASEKLRAQNNIHVQQMNTHEVKYGNTPG